MTEQDFSALLKKYPASRPDNLRGLWVLGRAVLFLSAGLFLSSRNETALWLAGQGILGITFLQFFFLVHDFGHGHFFSRPWMNEVAGQACALVILMPFNSWKYIHIKHHTWTGWRDLDPTMPARSLEQMGSGQRAFIDLCWKLWIPIISLAFSLGNLWNLKKVARLWPDRAVLWKCRLSIALIFLLYAPLIYLLGAARFLHYWGIAYLVFFVVSDPLMASQHSHLPQDHSEGKAVRPFPLWKQDVFTRELVFPRWVSNWILLGFNKHAMHHYFPAAPCYRLVEFNEPMANQIHWFEWLKKAKSMPAHLLLFSTSRETRVYL